MTKRRYKDIDIAKGIAIFLVVLGHIVARVPPPNSDWYVVLKNMIYLFHMPLFMFLSGLIMYLTFKPIHSGGEYGRYVGGKAKRLLPGFFFFAVLVVAGKMVAKQFLVVDNAPTTFWSDLLKIVIDPVNSSATSLWYIYVLFMYYVIFPPLLILVKQRIYLLPILGLILHFIPATHYFALNSIFEYFFVFALGMLAMQHYDKYSQILDRYRVFFLLLFGFSFILSFLNIDHVIVKLIVGLCSIPAVQSLARTRPFLNSSQLALYSKHTYAIYLMNTLAIGVTKAVLVQFIPWGGWGFVLMAPILLVAGLYGPIIVKTQIFARNRTLYAIVR